MRPEFRAPRLRPCNHRSGFAPDEVSLFNDLNRERSHLAGRYDDEFVVAFAGNEGDLTHGAITGSRRVSMRTLRRFEALGLLDVLARTDAAMAFDLTGGGARPRRAVKPARRSRADNVFLVWRVQVGRLQRLDRPADAGRHHQL